MATEFDEEAARRGVSGDTSPVARGTILTFVLDMPGAHVEDPQQDIRWQGRTTSAQFGVKIPADAAPPCVLGRVTVLQGGHPVGHVRFKVSITGSPPPAPEPAGTAHRYRHAFISYAAEDRAEVLRRVQMLEAIGVSYFQDVMNLGPGARWEKRLYENIDKADVFFLFWSNSAKNSAWVMKEVRYALDRKSGNEAAPPEIFPIPIENPIPEPPEDLAHLHFNDRVFLLLQSRAAMRARHAQGPA